MARLSKRMKAIRAQVDSTKQYDLTAAFTLLKKLSTLKFDESVDVSVNLGVDSRKSDQVVRSSTVLPKGTGRVVKVAVFAQGDKAEAAKAAGADIVGFEDLAESIKAGNMDFDVLIASPDAMRLVGQLGQILGPRGLMPNPKVGTVTADVANAVKNVKAGQARYRSDKNGIIHCSIGRVSFSPADLAENLDALLTDLKKLKPSTAKGIFLKKITVSTTMGPGLVVDQATLKVV
jgi:large subunit ribosomal protein L1